MPERLAPHRVTVIAPSPVALFNLAMPEMLFGKVVVDGRPGYEVVVCTAEPGPVPTTGGLDLHVPHGLEAVREADTVVVAGTGAPFEPDPRIVAALREAAAAGKRIASICTGAFQLAEAGLLQGRRATTYWAHAEVMRRRYPQVELRGDVLYVQDGPFLTSSGYAAGIDLCLHVIRTDYGAAVANEVARLALVAPVRPGGQTQFTQTPLPPSAATPVPTPAASPCATSTSRSPSPTWPGTRASACAPSPAGSTPRAGSAPFSGCCTSASNARRNSWRPRPCRWIRWPRPADSARPTRCAPTWSAGPVSPRAPTGPSSAGTEP